MKDEGSAGILPAGWGILGIEEGDFNHEWARIFTNGEGGMGNGREGRAGGDCGRGIFGD